MPSITLTADLDALAPISNFIAIATEQAGLDERSAWQVQLAVDEAVTNVIQHAYDQGDPGDLTLCWHCEGDKFVVLLHDYGRQFDPQQVPSPDISSPLEERQVGGLGIYLIMNLMDEVHFTFDPQDGNLLTMTKLLTVEPRRDTVTIPLQGRIDAASSPELQRTVQARIASGARFVLLTFEQVTFLSSSGLRALLLIRKELLALGGELRLAELQPNIHELFVLTGFTQVFAIHATTEDAHRAFGQGRA